MGNTSDRIRTDRRIGRACAAVVLGIITTLFVAWVLPPLVRGIFRSSVRTLPNSGAALRAPRSTGTITLGSTEVESTIVGDTYSFDAGWMSLQRGLDYEEAFVDTGIPGLSRPVDMGMYSTVVLIRTGWPWRAMKGEVWCSRGVRQYEHRWLWEAGSNRRDPILVPLRPIWRGFALNVIVVSSAWWWAMRIPVLQLSWWQAGRRLRCGCCPACGYDLKWNLGGGCPECGWRKVGTRRGMK